jgi:hypothetical protein
MFVLKVSIHVDFCICQDLNGALKQKRKVRGKLFEQNNIKSFVKVLNAQVNIDKKD